MKLIFTIFFLLINSLCFPQKYKLDSLIVETKNVNTTKAVNAYLNATSILITQNFNQCIQLANEGIIKANTLKDSISLARLFHNKGAAFYFKGFFDSASIYYLASIHILELKKDKSHLANSFNSLAKLFRKTKDLKRSLDYYDKALQIYEELNDKDGIAVINNESGVVFEYLRDFDEALRRYNFALNHATNINDSLAMSYSLNFIAGCYLQMKQYKKAEEYNLKSLAIRKKIKRSILFSTYLF
jgi:tetratricopeptide (TPR) repeat protein